MHPGRALRDAAGQYGEAGDAGCGGEYAGWNRISAHNGRSQKYARSGRKLEESIRRWERWAENYSDPGELAQAKRIESVQFIVQHLKVLSGFQSLNGDVMIVTIFIND